MRFHWTLFALPTLVHSAFVPSAPKIPVIFDVKTRQLSKQRLQSTASSDQSEAERLMQRARELRESATQSEYQVHVEMAEKKAKEDGKTDHLIDELFFKRGESDSLVDILRRKNLSIDTLEQIVDRLDEREVIADGKEHVRLTEEDGKAGFERVSLPDDAELKRVQGKIEELIEGVEVLDEEYRREKMNKREPYESHTGDQHWANGKRADRLWSRAHAIRRERDEQFQKRLNDFYEAQRIKEDQEPPPKAKDDHGFIS